MKVRNRYGKTGRVSSSCLLEPLVGCSCVHVEYRLRELEIAEFHCFLARISAASSSIARKIEPIFGSIPVCFLISFCLFTIFACSDLLMRVETSISAELSISKRLPDFLFVDKVDIRI